MPARFPAGRALRLLAASLVVTGVLAGPGSAGASGSTCEHWGGVPAPGRVLTGVAVVSACDAWAVGNSGIEHWNGSAWTVVASPDPGTASILDAVQAASRTDIWAVGSYTDSGGAGKTPLPHRDRNRLKKIATPPPGPAGHSKFGGPVLSPE